jgi:hypothetical protein
VVELIGNSAGRAASLPVLRWHLPYSWGKSAGKPHWWVEKSQSGYKNLNQGREISVRVQKPQSG